MSNSAERTTVGTTIAERLSRLRTLMEREGISAYVVNTYDPHFTEYPSCRWRALEYISGFTGSSGIAVVTREDALLWTDSRYFIQCEEELRGTAFRMMKDDGSAAGDFMEWLRCASRGKPAFEIGINGETLSIAVYRKMLKTGLKVRPLGDLVGEIWTERPEDKTSPAWVFPARFAGEGVESKIGKLRSRMEAECIDYTLFTALDSVAWILNLRASDIDFTPVFLSYLLVGRNSVVLFTDPSRFDELRRCSGRKKFESLASLVEILPYGDVFAYLEKIEGRVSLDFRKTNMRIAGCLGICQDIGPSGGQKQISSTGKADGGATGSEESRADVVDESQYLRFDLQPVHEEPRTDAGDVPGAGVEKTKDREKTCTGVTEFRDADFFALTENNQGKPRAEVIDERDEYLFALTGDNRGKPRTVVVDERDPAETLKACKNSSEVRGMEEAMLRDGAAFVRLLMRVRDSASWSRSEMGGKGSALSERSVSAELERLRREDADYLEPSFGTISAFMEHGAVVHYAPTEKTDKIIDRSGSLVLDFGGQYRFGTTDTTRTILIGGRRASYRAPSRLVADYTAVLKAHLALCRAVFPEGTTGHQLDALAKEQLWQFRETYFHGTGHGVGCCLSVHEGPMSISSRANGVALMPGMILSVEPGLYREGLWGIRIENLVKVSKFGKSEAGRFYRFQTITFMPYERRLIDKALLSPEEISQINDYHQCVYENLEPRLSVEEASFLRSLCEPL